MITFHLDRVPRDYEELARAVRRASLRSVRRSRWQAPERAIVGVRFGRRPRNAGRVLENVDRALVQTGLVRYTDPAHLRHTVLQGDTGSRRRGLWVTVVPCCPHGPIDAESEVMAVLTTSCSRLHNCDLCPLREDCVNLYDAVVGRT